HSWYPLTRRRNGPDICKKARIIMVRQEVISRAVLVRHVSAGRCGGAAALWAGAGARRDGSCLWRQAEDGAGPGHKERAARVYFGSGCDAGAAKLDRDGFDDGLFRGSRHDPAPNGPDRAAWGESGYGADRLDRRLGD